VFSAVFRHQNIVTVTVTGTAGVKESLLGLPCYNNNCVGYRLICSPTLVKIHFLLLGRIAVLLT